MSNLIIPNNDITIPGEPTPDSVKYKKDCPDFICMDDGTLIRECKYCQLSTQCRQTGIKPDGTWANMKSDYLPIVDLETNEVMEWEYFCTGMFPEEGRNDVVDDDKVS